MAPILVEPLSEKAYELLRQLEELHVLRVLTPEQAPATAANTPPRQWAGALAALSDDPAAAAAEWDKYLHDIRNEWERDM